MAPKSKTGKKQDVSTKSSKGNSTGAAGAAKSLPAAAAPPPPKWPPTSNLIPASDLSLVPLLNDQILTIPHLWTSSLCKTYTTFLSTLPLTTTPGKPRKGEAVRVNDRFQAEDPEFAERLWSGTALRELVTNAVVNGTILDEEGKRRLWGGDVLGLNGNIRVYRYSKGQFFDQHYDDSNNVIFPSPTSPSPILAKTTWTLLLYLTSPATGCKGGETVFYPDQPSKRDAAPPPVVAELEVGMALLHRHGKNCLLHEGREVTEGEKWIIRSDLCVKR